jgi:hypothetical protein
MRRQSLQVRRWAAVAVLGDRVQAIGDGELGVLVALEAAVARGRLVGRLSSWVSMVRWR